ncbi:B-box zinc finger protein [Myxococcus landrumensis]|uniref:B box-type domain-containing protein n=1 Tax=Myxococcus landrumensis TaxID=2813577 RepID=A0ABX7N048_9BACT|nr:B-box zinc finger protein [Myxococcus landrumus]QSQ11958.1 hypothetical protein JY572_26665 [Myxococcus landrumus]
MAPMVGVTPRCAVHPDEEADATCQRCGAFVCGTCATWVMSVLYCTDCAARPEVNYLEVFRLKFWGKRDANAWVVGIVSLGLIAGAAFAASQGEWLAAVVMLGAAGVGGGFFLGQRWARPALVLTPITAGLVAASVHGPGALVLSFLVFVSALQTFLDARNRLFFRVEVSEKDLRRLWDLRVNNPLARNALSLGITSFIIPVFAPFAVLVGALALRKVDLNARPPIGRKGQAMAAIVLGVGAVVFWVLVVIPYLQRLTNGRLFL